MQKNKPIIAHNASFLQMRCKQSRKETPMIAFWSPYKPIQPINTGLALNNDVICVHEDVLVQPGCDFAVREAIVEGN